MTFAKGGTSVPTHVSTHFLNLGSCTMPPLRFTLSRENAAAHAVGWSKLRIVVDPRIISRTPASFLTAFTTSSFVTTPRPFVSISAYTCAISSPGCGCSSSPTPRITEG